MADWYPTGTPWTGGAARFCRSLVERSTSCVTHLANLLYHIAGLPVIAGKIASRVEVVIGVVEHRVTKPDICGRLTPTDASHVDRQAAREAAAAHLSVEGGSAKACLAYNGRQAKNAISLL
jgi:hypothetical protein